MPLEVDEVDWLEAAIDQIHLLASTHSSFSCDDLRPLIAPPAHSNLWGTAFRVAESRRIIAYQSHQRSRTRSRRGGSLAVWVAHPSIHRTKEASIDCA
jgi:hypothetical protein